MHQCMQNTLINICMRHHVILVVPPLGWYCPNCWCKKAAMRYLFTVVMPVYRKSLERHTNLPAHARRCFDSWINGVVLTITALRHVTRDTVGLRQRYFTCIYYALDFELAVDYFSAKSGLASWSYKRLLRYCYSGWCQFFLVNNSMI